MPTSPASVGHRRVGLVRVLVAVAVAVVLVVATVAAFFTIYPIGRVERPSDGFSITFPWDWTVFDDTDLGIVAAWRLHADEDFCAVDHLDTLGLNGLSDHDALLRQYGQADDVVVELPSGTALRRDWTGEDGRGSSAYTLVGSEKVFTLRCQGPDVPADRWKSIADSFAFLPTGG